MSLILRIPSEELIQDFGLSTLALGAESKGFRLKMDEACQAAWADYKQRYLGDMILSVSAQDRENALYLSLYE